MTDMVFGTVAQQPRDPVLPRWWQTIDRWSLTFVMILFVMGILLGLAASVPLAQRNGLDPFYYVYKQLFFGIIALVVMIFTSMLSPKIVRRLGIIGFIFCFIAICLLPFLGTDYGKGAVRWYSLGFASVQPSEFLKPCFVIFSAWLMASSFSLILMFIMLIGVVGVGLFSYNNSEHFARRIDGFLNPDIDPRTQLGYATNAIQEGGFFGVGLGEGSVKWSLPDAHTDFIIAVAAEEYGLILVLVIISLFAAITVRSLLRLMNERNIFVRLSGTGIAVLFGMQAMINMGVAVRLLPAKGMTLPFVSYGGSSLVAGGIGLGMLLAFTRTRPQGDISDILISSKTIK